jgi:hypothetical protein
MLMYFNQKLKYVIKFQFKYYNIEILFKIEWKTKNYHLHIKNNKLLVRTYIDIKIIFYTIVNNTENKI